MPETKIGGLDINYESPLFRFIQDLEPNQRLEMGVARVRFRNEVVHRKTFTFEEPFGGKPKILMTGSYIRRDIPPSDHQFNGMEADKGEWFIDINFNECQGYTVTGFTTFIWIAKGPKASTTLESTIKVEQTGPMQITVRAGYFVDMKGNKYEVLDDQVIDLTADATYDKEIYIALVRNIDTGEVDIWVDDRVFDGYTYPAEVTDIEGNWELITPIIGRDWFIIPPGTTDITDVEKYYMAVIDKKARQVEF